MYGKKWWLALLAVGGVAAAVLLWPQAAVAQVGLDPAEGDAVWFFSQCSDSDSLDITAPNVTPDPPGGDRKTLQLQLDNGYPGYEFTCALYLANTGQIPLRVKTVSVANPHPESVSVAAAQPPAEVGQTLNPCPAVPAWGVPPETVPGDCRAAIELSVRVEAGAEEDAVYGYSIDILLESLTNP